MERTGAMSHEAHKHVCLCCETVSECTDEECPLIHEHIALMNCPRCTDHGEEQLPTVPQVLESGGVHVHVCLLCGKEWDCSNECGFPKGSVSELTCSLCVEHLFGFQQGQNSGALVPEMPVRDGIMHSHRCMIDNHMWEHDDFVCAMESMYDLECPACFVFAAT